MFLNAVHGFCMALADGEGYVLYVVGDADLMEHFTRRRCLPPAALESVKIIHPKKVKIVRGQEKIASCFLIFYEDGAKICQPVFPVFTASSSYSARVAGWSGALRRMVAPSVVVRRTQSGQER